MFLCYFTGADDESAYGPAVTNATLIVPRDPQKEAIEQAQLEALQALKSSLQAQKDAQLQLLQSTCNHRRGVVLYVAALLSQGVHNVCNNTLGTDVCVSLNGDDTVIAAAGAATNEQLTEISSSHAEEVHALDAALTQQLHYQTQLIQETVDTNLLILQHERDLEGLKLSLQANKDAQQAALKERLARKRAERVTELVGQGTYVCRKISVFNCLVFFFK